ncbi:MAG: OPT/YSL family transporter [Candidatus Njordarchaeia archaeon]
MSLGFTKRAILLGLLLNIVFTLVNSYLGINFGLGFSYTLITLMFVYVIFHKRNGSSPSEALIALISSTGFFMLNILALAAFIQVREPNSDLPTWFVPSKDVLINGSPFSPEWIVPLLVHAFITFSAIGLGLVISLAVSELVLKDKKLTFPYAKVTAVLIKSFFEKENKIRLLIIWILIGFLATFIQYLLKFFGIETLDLDFTNSLPYGTSFGIMVNLGVMAISYIIDPAMTITLLAGGIIYYLFIAPYFVKMGFFQPAPNAYDYYMNMLFQFSLSPGLGAFILSTPIIMVLKLLRRKKPSERAETQIEDEKRESNSINLENEEEHAEANLVNFVKELFRNLIGNKVLGLTYISLITAFILFVALFNIFAPLNMGLAIALSIMFLIPIGILDSFILIRMMGEVGMTFGVYRLVLYEGVIYTSGYRKYLGYLAYPISDPWMSSSLIYWFKIGEETNTGKKPILITFIIRLFVVYIISALFFLVAWYSFKIPSQIMPAISIIQWYAVVKIFVTGGSGTFLNLNTFLLGGVITGLICAFTPISPIGIALIMFLPPTYIIPLGIGGLLRYYTDKKYGKEWYDEKGQYIASGFLMGSILTQIILGILILT